MSWAWIDAWLTNFGPETRPMVVLVRDSQKIQALFPLRLEQKTLFFGKKINCLAFLQSCSQTCPDHLGWLAANSKVLSKANHALAGF